MIVVLGDQLFQGLPGTSENERIFMCEAGELACRVLHHRQKLVLFFSAMRHFAEGFPAERVHYVQWPNAGFWQELQAACSDRKITTYKPADAFFEQELKTFCLENDFALTLLPNPMFLTEHDHWRQYRARQKRLLMGDFYAFQRHRLGVLIEDDGRPIGGQWSFDADNRKPLPKHVLPPPVKTFEPDESTKAVMKLVDAEFRQHPGRAADFHYGVTHNEALFALDQFLVERLSCFGDYEDAIPQRERTLFHSLLTPYLNCGLLTPAQVVERTLQFSARQDVPLNSLEGFLRQVIGWREFIFQVDREYEAGRNFNANPFQHHRKLTEAWYSGETGLPPLDNVIRRAQRYGWIHHIERLMIVGSVMLMSEIDPDEAYRWFMEMTVDSADWVMRPNVYGMSQFADGGFFATKPYISGSAYILKMSDYPKGDWYEIWDGLYWRFIGRHQSTFLKNPRMATIARSYDRLDKERLNRIVRKADAFIERVTA